MGSLLVAYCLTTVFLIIAFGAAIMILQPIIIGIAFLTLPLWAPIYLFHKLIKSIGFYRYLGLKISNSYLGKIWQFIWIDLDDKKEKTAESRKAHQDSSTTSHKDDSPFSILGISKFASKEEISKAFRNKMKLNHPDMVNNLDPELQRFAKERTIKIKQAYDSLVS